MFDLDHLRHHPVQEIPVMGDDQDGSRIVQKIRLQAR